jgi:act minimal PKS acyl carrier protein
MANDEFTLEDLRLILRAAAGEDEEIDLDGDILDVPFYELGYDSLALLETGGRIERQLGVELGDQTVTEAENPRALLAAVNQVLASEQAA